ncbi:FAD-binding oxidoreductase [Haliea sp. E17]|uniref:FAD-binding oxidoreductase n=1 Tax=Haliea sp. E17 TaxID=3401576 RepID=UPI003AB0B190
MRFPAVPPPLLERPTEADIAFLTAIVGEKHGLRGKLEQAPYLTELRGQKTGHSPLVLRPRDTGEVAQILHYANQRKLGIVPQGGNSGLVYGQVPDDSGDNIVINLGRLNQVREIDTQGNTVTLGAGVILENLQQLAFEHDRFFPLSLGAEGSCQIGGNIATNAGGTAVLAYGNMRELVLGVEVVLANGDIWNGLRTLRKDNTGYDLKQLFIGSEGTLGIVTAAVVKLFPRPRSRATALLALESPATALAVMHTITASTGGQLTAFELIPRIGIDFVVRHSADARDPFDRAYPWYALIEVSSGAEGDSDEDPLTDSLTGAFQQGLLKDAAIAGSIAQAQQFWHLRHAIVECQRHEGKYMKFDLSIPIQLIPDFLQQTADTITTLIPGSRPLLFGHLGDGNIHYHISQPPAEDGTSFLARSAEVEKIIEDSVSELGGSMSAEHGIGAMKAARLPDWKSPLELEMMRGLKSALDPNWILNPGKLLLRS